MLQLKALMPDRTKIAIIEDDQAISQMYRMKFESDGFDVELATNGKSGVQMVQEYAPDVILMDINLPEMKGDEILAAIRAEDWGKEIPVMFLTNEAQSDNLHVLKDKQVLGYIVKAEMTPRQVVGRVKELAGLNQE
jgi:DNA-binding response OmpR family regulator